MSYIGVSYKCKTAKTIAKEDSEKRLAWLRQKVKERDIKRGTNYHVTKYKKTVTQKQHPIPYIPHGYYEKHKSRMKSPLVHHEPEWLSRIIMQRKAAMRESLQKNRPFKTSTTIYDDFTGEVVTTDGFYLTQKKRVLAMQDSKNHPRFPAFPVSDNPAPNAYNINYKLNAANSPQYTFGAKETEKCGGGQKAWASPYMRSSTPYNYKADYELRWPSPGVHYVRPTTTENTTFKKNCPKYSFGIKPKKEFWANKGEVPDCTTYFPNKTGKKSPAFSFGFKREGLFKNRNPPPDYYNVDKPQKHRSPAYSFNTNTKRFLKSYNTSSPFSSI